MLTEEIILSKNSNHIEISSIKKLIICSQDISDISILSKMKSLEILFFSNNKIFSLYPLSKCKNLREINLRKNNIVSFDELYYLQNLPKLKILCLEGNPISYEDNYIENVLKILPNLHYLDNKNVVNYQNLNYRNKKYKYMKRILTEEKKVRLDIDENKNISNLSNYKINNNNHKKIILKKVSSYYDSSNYEIQKENYNNISKDKNNYIQYLKIINKDNDKDKSERKKEINFKNIKLKFKNNKRTICNNILLNNYLKKCPKISYYRKQTVDINSKNTSAKNTINKNNNTVQNTLVHQNSSDEKSTTINTKLLFKGKNILNKKFKDNIKNLKLHKCNKEKENDNNYVMAASLLVNKIDIKDLILLKQVINKKIELLTK